MQMIIPTFCALIKVSLYDSWFSFSRVQIRWGDKLKHEANKHSVEEYMMFVEKWYKQREMRGVQVERTVFLATADASAREEAIAK